MSNIFSKIQNWWGLIIICTTVLATIATLASGYSNLTNRVSSVEEKTVTYSKEIQELRSDFFSHNLNESAYLAEIKKDLSYLKENMQEIKSDVKDIRKNDNSKSKQ